MTDLHGAKHRKAVRKKMAEELTDRVNSVLEDIWENWKTETPSDPDLFYREAYLAEQAFTSAHAKQTYRSALRVLIKANQPDFPELIIPSFPPTQKRLPPAKGDTWMTNGRLVRQTAKEVVEYWEKQREYSTEEAFGWLVFSAAVWGGLNNLKALDALVSFVKGKQKIHFVDGLPVCNLEVADKRYGNLYEEDAIAYARQFIPDATTQLWLIHLYKRVKVMQPSPFDALSCLKLAFSCSGQTLSFSQLREGASYVWEQLPGARVPQLYSRIAIGQQQSCSLSLMEMAMTLQDQFEPWEKVAQGLWLGEELPEDQQRGRSSEVVKSDDWSVKGQLRDLIRSPVARRRKANPDLDQHRDKLLSEYTKQSTQRLILWVYSLITEHPTLKLSSISRYLSALIKGWLKGIPDLSLEELDAEEWEEFYTQIIEDSGQSIGTTLTAINNFHHFQVENFQAPAIALQGNQSIEHVRARFVSPQLMDRCLKTLMRTRAYDDKELLMLECMIVLAWRTGLRIGEVTSLSIDDLSISGGPSVWHMQIDFLLIRSNALGTIKTNNARRKIPVFALLTEPEREKLNSVLHYRLSLGVKSNKPLFCPTSFGVSFSKSEVANVFRKLTNSNLVGSEYPFHSLRHTALSSIGLILSNSELTSSFVDRTEEDKERIRHALLGSHPGSGRLDSQDQYIALALLAGHGAPDQTFRSYYHFAHLDLGQRLLKARVKIPSTIPNNIAGISKRRISTSVASHDRHSTSVCSTDLLHLLKKDLAQWVRPWSINIPPPPEQERQRHLRDKKSSINPVSMTNIAPKDAFPSQPGTSVTMEMVYSALGYADGGESADIIARRFSIDVDLVQRWIDRAYYFATLTSSRGRPRLIDPKRVSDEGTAPLQPLKRFSKEEYDMIERFMVWAPKTYCNSPQVLIKFLNVYLKQATGSRAGVRFRKSEVKTLQSFLETVFKVLPPANWRLVCRTKKECAEIKASKPKRWKKLHTGSHKTGYNGYSLYLRHPQEDRILSSQDMKSYSSGALRYVVHMLLIAWPGSDVGKRKLLRDPFMSRK